MRTLVEYFDRFYIAVQDGRLDNETFDTEALAEAARKKLPKMLRASTCVMSSRQVREVSVIEKTLTRCELSRAKNRRRK